MAILYSYHTTLLAVYHVDMCSIDWITAQRSLIMVRVKHYFLLVDDPNPFNESKFKL